MKKYADGGNASYNYNRQIADTILLQLGNAGRLKMMTGAYNFSVIPSGVSFRIKNPRANYIKITLTPMDLYDLEVGRVRGTTYKVIAKHEGVYNDMLKPLIEKATGMYLSLFAKGGKLVYDREKYVKLLDEYDKVGAYLEDATTEQERAKYKKKLSEIESELHRYERNYAKGGGVGKSKSYLHLYKLTYPNGQYRVESYDGEAMTPKEALEKMRISLRGLKSYKYSGASSDSENYKKWYQTKDMGYSDTDAWDKVFGSEKMAKGGAMKKHTVKYDKNMGGGMWIILNPQGKKVGDEFLNKENAQWYAKKFDEGYKSKFAKGGGIKTDRYKDFDLNTDGDFYLKDNDNEYVIRHSGNPNLENEYVLIKNGKRVRKSTDLRSLFKFAKGGMTEHGLKLNDTIKGGKQIGTTIRVHNPNYGDARVDLDKGKRTELEYNRKTKKYEEKMAKGGLMGKLKSTASNLGKSVKSGYSKGKQYAKNKLHQKKKDIALDVIYETKEKLAKGRDEMMATEKAYNVVDKRYSKGGGTGMLLIAYGDSDYDNRIGHFTSLKLAKDFAKKNQLKYSTILFEDQFGDNIVVHNGDTNEDIDWLFSTERMAKGGKVEKHVDLFEDYEQMPPKIAKIFDKYWNKYGEDMDYGIIAKLHDEVYKHGYTFESGLDATMYGLRPKGVKLNQLEGYEDVNESSDDELFAEGGKTSNTNMKLNRENAKSFNASLKKAFKEGGMNGVKVRIINSYKFPNCWVEVWFPNGTGEFSNDFRLRVFDASGFKRESLLNASDVSYGNIQKHSISAKVWEWEKVFNNEMAKGGAVDSVGSKAKNKFAEELGIASSRLNKFKFDGTDSMSALYKVVVSAKKSDSGLDENLIESKYEQAREDAKHHSMNISTKGKMAQGGAIGGFNYSIGGL